MTIDTNDTVSLDTLKEQGFTDEDLAGLTPEPTPEATPEPQQELEQPEPTPEPVEEQPVPDHDNVSKHVPYDRFKEVNDKNKLLAAELAALKAQQPQQPQTTHQQPPTQPQSQPQAQVDVRTAILKYAEQEAKKRLGIDGDPRDLKYAEDDKYEEYMTEKATIAFQETVKHQKSQETLNENKEFVRELQSTPDFPVLYQFSQQELRTLPFGEAIEISDSFNRINAGQGTKTDFDTVRTFANQCREKMTGIRSQPPAQQQGGFSMPQTPAPSPLDKAAGLPRSQSLSGAKTGAMSWSQVEQLINEGKADQIPKDMLKQIDPRLV